MSDCLRRCLLSGLWLLLCAGAAGACAAPAVDFAAAASNAMLDVSSVELLEDPGGDLDLQAVRARPDAAWTVPRTMPLNLGYSTSAWWLRVRLENSDRDAARERLVEVASPIQDYVDVAWVDSRDGVTRFPPTGDRRPFGQRLQPHPTPLFPLTLAPGAGGTLFVRLDTHDGLHEFVSIVLWERTAFVGAAQVRALAYGVCDGLLLVLLLYSGFLWVWSRQRIFGAYCGYLVGTALWTAIYTGQALQFLWPQSPVLDNQLFPPVIAFSCFFGIRFTAESLQLKRRLPRWHVLTTRLAAAGAAAALPALAGHYALPFALCLPVVAVTGVVQLLAALVLAVRGSRRAMWTVAAFMLFLLAVAAHTLDRLGLVPTHGGNPDVLLAGVSLQVLLLGLSLADTAERMRSAKVAAERHARAAQQQLATRLAGQVRERTLELEQANRRLGELAITDALTGAFNRRHFNEMLEAEIARQRRDGRMPALCLIDVDQFKTYNDRYGHAKGDAVLKAVADALSGCLARAEDRLYRVGGEEFAIILRPGDTAIQRAYVEGLRRAVESLAIPHEGHPAGVVTASFGLAQDAEAGAADRPVRASALYREADRLLYAAKAGGRNRVECSMSAVAEWAPSSDFSSL